MNLLLLAASFGPMLLAASCLYLWLLGPALDKLKPRVALQALLAVHCLRFISPISLVSGVTLPGLATAFTWPQVVGDMSAAVLALVAIAGLRFGWRHALQWVWFTSLFGLLDLLVVAVQGVQHRFADHVGAMFYVVAWFVPWLLVSHVAILARLVRPAAVQPAARPRSS